MIVDAVNESLPNKVGKLVNAKTAGAAEAHLFLWLNSAQEHKRGRAEAMSFLSRTGLDGLEPIDLQGIDAARVAVDAGPSHAPDCRHHWPILCFDADGWHDRQLRRSPRRRPDPQMEALAAVRLAAEEPPQSRRRHTSPGLTTGSSSAEHDDLEVLRASRSHRQARQRHEEPAQNATHGTPGSGASHLFGALRPSFGHPRLPGCSASCLVSAHDRIFGHPQARNGFPSVASWRLDAGYGCAGVKALKSWSPRLT